VLLTATLAGLRASGVLSALDEHLARTLGRLAHEEDPQVLLLTALVSRHVAHGHVCLPVSALARGEISLGEDSATLASAWPEPAEWLAALRRSPLCGTRSGESTPLVLDPQGRLYLRRHFERERRLASNLRLRAERVLDCDPERLRARLDHYFGREPDDRQRAAAELAQRRALCVISGGPGTGKTSTVVKILAVAIEEARAQGSSLRIGLMAPTGKAAVRLESAVRGAKVELACDPDVRAAIPEEATTIHRALRGRARRLAADGGKLRLDLLLVDEASMVDLELMTELFDALPAEARVILLGDRDQLASVEAGAVLGDICGVEQDSALSQAVTTLTRSYRYAADRGIGLLARAVRDGAVERALAVLDDPDQPEVSWSASQPGGGLTPQLEAALVNGYRDYLEAWAEPARALPLFDRFRVLCAHRHGPHGVETLNLAIVRALYAAQLLESDDPHGVGLPLLVTENDYHNRLWNGDVGMCSRGARGERVACFLGQDQRVRELGLSRLPAHECAFAMSVHKSQGSEVDEVALILPETTSSLLSRELVYTAITRARRRVVVYAPREVLAAAIAQRVVRSTGLRELL
jgi:exodeoxyribonuclease V alpha subunit